jgi:UDP-N-acetylmuramate-alanine ligase
METVGTKSRSVLEAPAPAVKSVSAEPTRGGRTAVDLVPGIPRRVHLVGAGGAGLSGAAQILRARGHEVSGHDGADSSFVQRLRSQGIDVVVGPSQAAILSDDAELVARSAAIGHDDPQLAAARARGLPILKYAELLGRIGPARRTIGIAGTHGKTTTSWMTYHALRGIAEAAGRTHAAPGALIGGTCRTTRYKSVAPHNKRWLACESCE